MQRQGVALIVLVLVAHVHAAITTIDSNPSRIGCDAHSRLAMKAKRVSLKYIDSVLLPTVTNTAVRSLLQNVKETLENVTVNCQDSEELLQTTNSVQLQSIVTVVDATDPDDVLSTANTWIRCALGFLVVGTTFIWLRPERDQIHIPDLRELPLSARLGYIFGQYGTKGQVQSVTLLVIRFIKSFGLNFVFMLMGLCFLYRGLSNMVYRTSILPTSQFLSSKHPIIICKQLSETAITNVWKDTDSTYCFPLKPVDRIQPSTVHSALTTRWELPSTFQPNADDSVFLVIRDEIYGVVTYPKVSVWTSIDEENVLMTCKTEDCTALPWFSPFNNRVMKLAVKHKFFETDQSCFAPIRLTLRTDAMVRVYYVFGHGCSAQFQPRDLWYPTKTTKKKLTWVLA